MGSMYSMPMPAPTRVVSAMLPSSSAHDSDSEKVYSFTVALTIYSTVLIPEAYSEKAIRSGGARHYMSSSIHIVGVCTPCYESGFPELNSAAVRDRLVAFSLASGVAFYRKTGDRVPIPVVAIVFGILSLFFGAIREEGPRGTETIVRRDPSSYSKAGSEEA